MKKAIDLKERKSQDYQGSIFREDDYFPYGHKSFMHMIHTKYLRMRSVVEQKGETNFESLEDTLLDMISYCAMYGAWIERESFLEQPTSRPTSAVGNDGGLEKHAIEPHEDLDRLRGRQPRNSVTWRG